MTNDEKTIVKKFAAGDKQLREAAIAAALRATRAGEPRTVHDEFMSEIDTSMPDLGLRAMFRAKLAKEQSQASGETEKETTSEDQTTTNDTRHDPSPGRR